MPDNSLLPEVGIVAIMIISYVVKQYFQFSWAIYWGLVVLLIVMFFEKIW